MGRDRGVALVIVRGGEIEESWRLERATEDKSTKHLNGQGEIIWCIYFNIVIFFGYIYECRLSISL